jgi:hypothetical protein
MKHISLSLSLALLLALYGCSASTEVNGGGAYQPEEETGFSTVFIGGYASGMFYSTDTCKTWQTPAQNTSPRIYSIASSTNYVFAGGIATGLFRSSDNGKNWVHVNVLIDTNFYSVHASGAVVIAGGVNAGLLTSTDEGETWTLTAPFSPGVASITSIGNTFFAAAGTEGLLRSTDRGMTWQAISNDFGLSISTVGVSGQMLFASTSGAGVLRSTDMGDHWEHFSAPLVTYGISGNGKQLFGGGSNGLAISNDSGATWSAVPQVTGLVLRPMARGKFIFAASNPRGMFMSTDNGSTWLHRNNGLFDTLDYSMGVH